MNGPRAGKRTAIVILNGISLKKKLFYHDYFPAISQIFDVEVHETLSQNDARLLASKFTERYPDVILAAGGDGTLNQVVNGVLKDRESETKLPTLGLIPIGSGNDFARSAGMRINADHLLNLFSDYKPKAVDVGIIEYAIKPDHDGEKACSYFVNVADIGMGPLVVEKVLSSGRPFGSEVAYLKSILNTFLTYKPMTVKAACPEWTWEGKVRTLAVANGKYYGHGLCIAPDAVMGDGKFSVFICGNVSALDFIMHMGALKRGKKIQLDEVTYKEATSLELTSERPCPIEGDGEILGWLPARVRIIKKQLNFLI